MGAEGGAGQPLVAVAVRTVFAFELVGAAGGDPAVIGVAVDGVIAQAGGGGDQRFGQGGAVPAALDQHGSLAVGLDAELVDPVVHDGAVAKRAGGEVEALGERGRGAGRPGGGGDGGLQRPGEFAQRLALVVLAVAVVALADVPAAVRVAGR